MSAFGAGAAPAPAPPASLDFRVLRAVPFATVCVVLAAAGHTLASGATVPIRAVLLGWVLTLGAAVLGARRERSLAAITGGLAVGQLGLHLLFHAEQTPARAQAMPNTAGMAGMADMPGMPGMGMADGTHSRAVAAQLAMPLGSGSHASAAATPHVALWCHAWLLGLSPAMFAGHLAATLVAAWWLRRGEAAVWRLVRTTAEAASAAAQACTARLREVVARLDAALSGGIGRGWRPLCAWFAGAGRRWRLPSPVLLRHCVIRRGPPIAPPA
ncbi:hypothetical protein [Kitasatospora sp. GP82]|uniref:hypothetical protein n=1 Tax=Kitasatospora sp. GP82 TaxID=3035089 RepID=UPI0024744332|nr:hypothetical protein [Kitasatospora sp. GP82]MDH6129965.1 hypothetical protein [Kitasatospora sp. GP82]